MAASNGLVPNEDGKKINCSFCNCWLPSVSSKFVDAHISGRKHVYNVQNQQKKELKFKRSVFVKGFEPLLPCLEEELKNYFQTLECPVNDIYVDKNVAAYSIIEFHAEESVEKVMQLNEHVFYGKQLIVRRREKMHSTNKPSTKCASSLCSEEFFSGLDKCNSIDSQMELLQACFQLTENDLVLRQLVCELLQSVLEEVFPKCKVVQFGSSASGLGMKGCDIDLTLLIDSDDRDQKETMHEVRDVIQRFAPGCKSVSLVQSAKNCTIVKFLHTDSSLSVDLSLNNRLAVANTELLTAYINADKRVSLLLFTIRTWARFNNLTGRSGLQLSNYALTLMVVHFLQHTNPPVLLCLQDCCALQEQMIDFWNCSFCKECTITNESSITNQNKRNSGELLKEFFEYYSKFDFAKYAVTVHSSRLILKKELEILPHCSTNMLEINSPILVQDPFKRSHNVAQNVSLAGRELFLRMCKLAVTSLPYSFKKLFHANEFKHKKRKPAKSHQYTISLPNCKHTAEASLLCCEEFVLNLLKEDFKMLIEANKTVTPPKNDISKTNDSCVKNDINQDEVQNNLLKRKLSAEFSTELKKKRVVDENYFTIVAQSDTWTNRRKNQRILKYKAPIESTVNSQDGESMGQSSEVFSCCLHIDKGKHPLAVCKVNFEPSVSESNLLRFQTFFALFKKSLLSVFY